MNTINVIKTFVGHDANKQIKIGVIGDILLDEYYFVDAGRISPEFPIQILKSNTHSPQKTLPGGAANVAYQTSEFNVDCTLFGCVDPEAAAQLHRYKFKLVCENHGKRIPRKKRFYDGKHALMRWDVEDLHEEDFGDWSIARDKLLKKIQDFIETKPDIIILSDYNKGFFKNDIAKKIINLCNKNNIKTIVDPKSKPIHRWKGCTVFKPNYNESVHLSDQNESPCCYLKDKLDCDAVIVTMGKLGVITHDGTNNKCKTYCPDRAIPEQSVIGAGDCFAAVYAIALAHGVTYDEASIIAYESGSLYVQRHHNTPITPLELHLSTDPVNGKIIKSNIIKKSNEKLVFCNGVFDLGLHKAHLELLRYAKSLGDKLIVAINSDSSTSQLKGPNRPIINQYDRALSLACLSFVDYVVVFDELTPKSLIESIMPAIIVKGGDYKKNDVIGSEIVGVNNVIIFDYQPDISVTKTIEKIKSQD